MNEQLQRIEQPQSMALDASGRKAAIDDLMNKVALVMECMDRVIHRGHQYGTLDTINEWDWSGDTAQPLPPKTYPAIPQDTLAIG